MQKNKNPRAPDKIKTNKKTAIDVLLYQLECSKQVLFVGLLLFGLQMLATIITVIINPALDESLTEILSTCKSVYTVIIGGYFGKAALENSLKITSSVNEITEETEDDEDGNG